MLETELKLAIRLAREAGDIAMAIYDTEFTAEKKADRSPVTAADRAINTLLCDALAAAFPQDLIVGEESDFGGVVPAIGRAWFIDPIDGTKDFILKNGEWSIMIGLTIDGVATLGVVYEPVHDRLYYAVQGEGAWVDAGGEFKRLERVAHKEPSEAIIVNSRNHPDARITRVVERLGASREFVHGSIGCKLARIAEGRADLYFNFSGKCSMWDTCGPEVIIREAGGDLVDFEGRALLYAGATTRLPRPFFASTAALLEPTREVILSMADELQPE